MKVKDLLESRQLLSDEIQTVNFHMNLLHCKVDDLKAKFPELRNKSAEELANILVNIFHKCNASNEQYDPQLDEEMIRFGLKTNDFLGPHSTSKWDTGFFEDDDFGFGNRETNQYDGYLDSIDNDKRFRR